jgi:uncharacterized OB-fold protein
VATDTTALEPPRPAPDKLTQFFWDGVQAHKLLILRCNNGHYIHWPKVVCRFCLSTDLAPVEVSGRGKVATFTLPNQPFHPYFQAKIPYVLAVIELEEQENLKLVSNIVDIDPDDVRIGMPVEVTFQEVSPGYTLPLFKPAAGTAGA